MKLTANQKKIRNERNEFARKNFFKKPGELKFALPAARTLDCKLSCMELLASVKSKKGE